MFITNVKTPSVHGEHFCDRGDGQSGVAERLKSRFVRFNAWLPEEETTSFKVV